MRNLSHVRYSHLIQSATARILSSGSGTLAIRDYNEVVTSEVRVLSTDRIPTIACVLKVGLAGKEIILTGNASTVIYQALLNNITYRNW